MAQATLKSEVDGLVRLAAADLNHLWNLVADGAAAEVALRDLLPAIVAEYGQLGAATAAEWYDDQRAKADVRHRFSAIPQPASDRGAHALIGYALATAVDDTSLHKLILGGTQKRIADHMRLTVTTSALKDPASEGWVRVGRGECQWCQQYLDGEIRSVAYDFPAHDFCNCEAVPAF